MSEEDIFEGLPLCQFFLKEYLIRNPDSPLSNRKGAEASEELLAESLKVLKLLPEELNKRSDFKFRNFSPTELDAAFGVLRTVIALSSLGFENITLIKVGNSAGADLTFDHIGMHQCCEVKTFTTKSDRQARSNEFLEDQVLNKIRDILPQARRQLVSSKKIFGSDYTMLSIVINWLAHSAVLSFSDLQWIANQLDIGEEMKDIDLLLLITKLGEKHLFVSDRLRPGLF